MCTVCAKGRERGRTEGRDTLTLNNLRLLLVGITICTSCCFTSLHPTINIINVLCNFCHSPCCFREPTCHPAASKAITHTMFLGAVDSRVGLIAEERVRLHSVLVANPLCHTLQSLCLLSLPETTPLSSRQWPPASALLPFQRYYAHPLLFSQWFQPTPSHRFFPLFHRCHRTLLSPASLPW